jgi:uncharacterized membrane protein YccC
MGVWAKRLGLSREAVITSLRTAVPAVLSLLAARSLKMQEFYWAPISSIVIMLSTINPLTLAWQRFAGTALGVAVGALIASFASPNWIAYGAGILACGILSSLLRLGNAYRFADQPRQSPLDRGHTPLRRSVTGNRGGADGDAGVARSRESAG